ncbi:MAG: hypothetical protein ACKORE_05575, partial [Bacteroidota bacterium]
MTILFQNQIPGFRKSEYGRQIPDDARWYSGIYQFRHHLGTVFQDECRLKFFLENQPVYNTGR